MYSALTVLFEGELNPVHQSAIEHVPIPEGLNLDEWIHEPPPEQSFDVCCLLHVLSFPFFVCLSYGLLVSWRVSHGLPVSWRVSSGH